MNSFCAKGSQSRVSRWKPFFRAPHSTPAFRLFFCVSVLLLASCETRALGMPVWEAENRLAHGDIGFVRDAEVSRLGELAKVDECAPFFAALLLREALGAGTVEGAGDGAERYQALLKAALRSPLTSGPAAELLLRIYPPPAPDEGEAAGFAFSRKDYAGALAEYRALFTTEASVTGEYTPTDAFFSATPEQIGEFGLSCQYAGWRLPGAAVFDVAEKALAAGSAPQAAPPDAAPQAAPPPAAPPPDAALPAAPPPDAALPAAPPPDAALPAASAESARLRLYLCRYYSGRLLRAAGERKAAASRFESALEAAPDSLQSDACLWYILDLTDGITETACAIVKYAPLWKEAASFDDILDSLSQKSAASGRWNIYERLEPVLAQYASSEAAAQYAYILARAAEEGYIKGRDPAPLFATAAARGGNSFYAVMARRREGLNEGAGSREQGAGGKWEVGSGQKRDAETERTTGKHLGSPPDFRTETLPTSSSHSQLPTNNSQSKPNSQLPSENPHSPLPFLRGFFRYALPHRALPYIEENLSVLTLEETRELAGLLTRAGLYTDTIRLYASWIRQGGSMERPDYQLYYPRAFRPVVEQAAASYGLSSSSLYGLIRAESAFDAAAKSRVGAVGLTQLMASTAEEAARKVLSAGGPDYTGGEAGPDLLDVETNVTLGAYYLSYLTSVTGSPLKALLAYNGGLGRVRRWERTLRLPDDLLLEACDIAETRDYGRKVTAASAVYASLYGE